MKTASASKSVLVKKIIGSDIRPMMDRLTAAPALHRKAVLWGLIFFFASWFVLQTVPFIHEWDTDSPSYYTAAHGLRKNINIYDDQELQPLGDILFGKSFVVYPYIYPPLLAQLCLPLSYLPPSTYFLMIYVVNILLVFLGLFLMFDLLGLGDGRSLLPALVPFFLLPFNEPLLTTIHHGQINLLVFDAILLFLVLPKKGKPVLAAFFLSLAVFLKIYPILFILPLLVQKRLRSLAAFAAGSVGLLAASLLISGPAPWLDFMKSTIALFFKKPDSPFTRGFQNSFGNVSLKGFLTQAFSRFHLPESAVVPVFLLLVAFLLVWIFSISRKKAFNSDLARESSIFFILTLLLAPITWSHHFVIMLMPVAYLAGRTISEKKYPAFILLAFLTSQIFYQLPWGAFPFNQVRFFATLGFLAMLLHFAKKSPRELHAS